MRRVIGYLLVLTCLFFQAGATHTATRFSGGSRLVQPTIESMPDHVVYEFLFRRVLRDPINLPPELALHAAQAGTLHQVASRCLTQVNGLDTAIRQLILHRRSQYPNGIIRHPDRPPSPSQELINMQTTRNAQILNARSELEATFGPATFAEFDMAVKQLIAKGSRRIQPKR